MGKRDLEKLRREHKEKFSRTKISSTRNFKAEQALTSNPNLKEETKSIPESNRTLRILIDKFIEQSLES